MIGGFDHVTLFFLLIKSITESIPVWRLQYKSQETQAHVGGKQRP